MNIEIYSKTDCPFCQMTKRVLTEHKIAYQETLFDDETERQAMYDRLGLAGSKRTVPQVLLHDNGVATRIGGYRDLLDSEFLRRQQAGTFDAEF